MLLDTEVLRRRLEAHQERPRVRTWLAELASADATQLSGIASQLMRETRLIDSAVGPSLGSGVDAIRLEDVVQARTTLLISLDARRSPSLAQILGGWALVAMQRACLHVPRGNSCLMVVDELGSLGHQARHVEPLLAMGRDAGVGVVVAAH